MAVRKRPPRGSRFRATRTTRSSFQVKLSERAELLTAAELDRALSLHLSAFRRWLQSPRSRARPYFATRSFKGGSAFYVASEQDDQITYVFTLPEIRKSPLFDRSDDFDLAMIADACAEAESN